MHDDVEKKVKKRIRARKAFLIHLGTYIAAGLFFLAMNIATMAPGEEWWFFFPMIPWGLGLAIHYVAAFGFPGTDDLVKRWEIEETAKEMKRQREAGNKNLPPAKKPDDSLDLEELKRQKEKLYDEDDLV